MLGDKLEGLEEVRLAVIGQIWILEEKSLYEMEMSFI